MSGGQAEVLASLRLVQGRSPSQRREFSSATPQSIITVGNDPKCDWLVEDADVAPIHFSLHWDGSSLRVADIHGAGKVRVDGMLVGNQWRRIGRRARVEFGSAAIVVELSANASDGGSWSPNRYNVTLAEVGQVSAATPNGGAAVARESPGRYSKAEGAVAVERAGPSVAPGPASQSVAPPAEVESAEKRTPSGTPNHVVHVATIARVGSDAPVAPLAETEVLAGRPESAPSSALVVHAENDTGWSGAGYDGANASNRGYAQRVMVLTPLGGGAPAPSASFDHRRLREPPAVGWKAVVLGFLSVAVGYACWLYLLYHL